MTTIKDEEWWTRVVDKWRATGLLQGLTGSREWYVANCLDGAENLPYMKDSLFRNMFYPVLRRVAGQEEVDWLDLQWLADDFLLWLRPYRAELQMDLTMCAGRFNRELELVVQYVQDVTPRLPKPKTYGDRFGHPGCHGCQICFGNDPALDGTGPIPDEWITDLENSGPEEELDHVPF